MNAKLAAMKPALLAFFALATLQAQSPDARQQLIAYLNTQAKAPLEARAKEIAAFKTKAEAEQRQSVVRETILRLIGDLPHPAGPVPVKTFGNVPFDGFHVEKIAFESLPGFFVTADVYVPDSGEPPFPAVLVTPGHGPTGKLGDFGWGANLARAGLIALSVDPMGQGERLQHYDSAQKKSIVGQGTGEHGYAGFSTLLIGDHVSRYFINDAIRAVDYLTERKDVDAGRIGAFGCSGGGTATAYIAAIDVRIRAAASACYVTAFEELLPSPTGNQEAEQSIPRFIADGLDLADWVELAAPKPYAIVSTTEDMFPIAGAKRTYEEATHFYALMGAPDNIQWITGPGGHGALGPISPQILAFLVNSLKRDPGRIDFKPYPRDPHENLVVTKTGQVSSSLDSVSIESINRDRAKEVMRAKPLILTRGDLDSLQADLKIAVRGAAAISAEPGPAPQVTTEKTDQRDGYRLETLTFHSEPGIDLPAQLAIPLKGSRHHAVLVFDNQNLESLAKAGNIVLFLQPRGTPGPDKPVQSPNLGPFNLISLRAMLVGKTLVGMRVDDAIRAVNLLAARSDLDRTGIGIEAKGAMGVVALHAAAIDPRISRVTAENTLASYQLALEPEPLYFDLPEVIVPGVLRHYDLPDLIIAMCPRPVTLINPAGADGKPLDPDAAEELFSDVEEAGHNLGRSRQLTVTFKPL